MHIAHRYIKQCKCNSSSNIGGMGSTEKVSPDRTIIDIVFTVGKNLTPVCDNCRIPWENANVEHGNMETFLQLLEALNVKEKK